MPSTKAKTASSKEDDESPSSKRLRSHSGGSTTTTATTTPTTSSAPPPNTLTSRLQQSLDALRSLTSKEGRVHSDTVARVPSRRAHADYYACVKEPIDLSLMQLKIKSGEYKSGAEFEADVRLLVANAKLYHKKSSPEHKDAQALLDFYETSLKSKEAEEAPLPPPPPPPPTATTAVADEQDNNEEEEEGEPVAKKRGSRAPLRSPSSSERASPRKAVATHPLAAPPPAQLASHLEEFFNSMAAYKCPESKRSLAIVFYMLPSSKVSL